jgi:uncharacterized membrane protein YeaQ/YmgE (transglycosylase-associated protein family)
MNIIAWIIFGAIAGWLASIILKTNDEQGAIGNVVVGIIGAAVGGWISGLVFDGSGVTGFNVRSFIVAVLGAVVFLLIKGALTGKRSV